MSIRTIDDNTVNRKGLEKQIDKGAHRLVFDILQNTQYSHPIPSTVRELATNAWDAQREKEVAIEILTGKRKVEDYYIRREGAQYDASNWDPSYYDLRYLSDQNMVTLRYTEKDGTGFCDTFEVIDRGVGLSLKRLEGMLSLGFSTKRNTTEGFGAFGLGAKVAFSTGVPSYMVESVYNGRYHRCICYPHSTSFTVPRFDEEGNENPYDTLSDGVTKVYYQPTKKKNGTRIVFGVKRHHRGAFSEAVFEQLMYVKGIEFTVIDEYGNESTSITEKPIMYSSENLVISHDTSYRVPHIVVVKSSNDTAGICYGAVDFKELEMEQLWGSVGFKCPIRQVYRDDDGNEVVVSEGVAVTPSREKVIWNDDTKNYILKVIREAEEEARVMITSQLADSNKGLFQWMHNADQVLGSVFSDKNSLLGRLSGIVDRTKIDASHPVHDSISYSPHKHLKKVFGNMIFENVSLNHKGEPVINETEHLNGVNWLELYEKDENYSKNRNRYICSQSGTGSFSTWRIVDNSLDLQDPLKALTTTERSVHILRNDPLYRRYSDVQVPEEYLKDMEALELKVDIDNLSPADRRKLEQREVAFVPMSGGDWRNSSFILKKIQPKRHELLNPKHETYWFLKEERTDVERLLTSIQCDVPTWKDLSDWGNNTPCFGCEFEMEGEQYLFQHLTPDPSVITFVQLNQSLANEEHGKNLNHWTSMLRQRSGSILTVHPLILRAHTRSKVKDRDLVFEARFLEYYKGLPEAKDMRKRLQDLVRTGSSRPLPDMITKAIRKMEEFQEQVQENLTEDELKMLSFKYFKFTDITGAVVVDKVFLEEYQILSDFIAPIQDLMNSIGVYDFKETKVNLEILKYLAIHGRDDWDKWRSLYDSTDNNNQNQ